MLELSNKSNLYRVEDTRGFRKVIVDKEDKRVFGEFPYYTDFSFYGPAVIGKNMDGEGRISYHICSKSEETGRIERIFCSDFELLENGNILVRFYGDRKDFIFDPKQAKRVSENVDTIGQFKNHDQQTGITYAYATISIPRETHSKFTLFTLWGKMDVSGKFVSDLYNRETGEVWKINEEGFSFPQKVQDTREIMMREEERKRREIDELPIKSKRK